MLLGPTLLPALLLPWSWPCSWPCSWLMLLIVFLVMLLTMPLTMLLIMPFLGHTFGHTSDHAPSHAFNHAPGLAILQQTDDPWTLFSRVWLHLALRLPRIILIGDAGLSKTSRVATFTLSATIGIEQCLQTTRLSDETLHGTIIGVCSLDCSDMGAL